MVPAVESHSMEDRVGYEGLCWVAANGTWGRGFVFQQRAYGRSCRDSSNVTGVYRAGLCMMQCVLSLTLKFEWLMGRYAIDATLECFIHDISYLASQLEEVRFMFVKRNGNVAAHVIALYVASHGDAFHLDALSSKFLFNILAEDVKVSIRI